MVIQVQIAGVGTLEFPDNTPEDVIQQAVDTTVKKPAAAPQASLPQDTLTATPGLPRQLLRKAKATQEQFQKGVEIQNREVGELLGGVPQVEQLKETREPVGAIEKTGRFAGEFLAPSPMVASIPGLAFTINTTAGLLSDSLKATKAGRFISGKGKDMVDAIASGTKKSVGFVGEVLSAVPREFFEKAIDAEVAGNSIFKGSFDKKVFSELGERAQKAMNFIRKEAGKEVGELKKATKGKKLAIRTNEVVNFIDNEIAERTAGGITSLDPSDIKFLNETKKALGEFTDIDKAIVLKKKLQNAVKFDPQTVSKVSGEGQGIVKNVGKQIDELIELTAPDLGEVNKKFSKIADLQTRLQTKLKDENVAKNLRNLVNQDEAIKNMFIELDEFSPDAFKFMEDLSRATVRNAFDSLFPGAGGGSGSAAGFANILRIGGVGATHPAALPLISPKVQGLAIQGTGKTVRGEGLLGLPSKGVQATGRLLGSATPEFATETATKPLRRLIRTKED